MRSAYFGFTPERETTFSVLRCFLDVGRIVFFALQIRFFFATMLTSMSL